MTIGIGDIFANAAGAIANADKKPVVDGKYLGRIESCTYALKESGAEGIEFRVLLFNGKYADGSPAENYSVFGTQWRLGRDKNTSQEGRFFKTLLDLGLDKTFFAAPGLTWEHVATSLVGRNVQVTVKAETYQDKVTSKVSWLNKVPDADLITANALAAAKPMKGATTAQATANLTIPALAGDAPAEQPAQTPAQVSAPGGMSFNPTV